MYFIYFFLDTLKLQNTYFDLNGSTWSILRLNESTESHHDVYRIGFRPSFLSLLYEKQIAFRNECITVATYPSWCKIYYLFIIRLVARPIAANCCFLIGHGYIESQVDLCHSEIQAPSTR